ncbi:extracellular sulfatase Sulf-1 isoform X1 [Sigmodon hispidus]
MGWEEIRHIEGDISGNGMTERGLQSHCGLQPISQHQQERSQDAEPEEDAFEDQLHPPVRSDRISVHQVFNVSSVEQPMHSSHTERLLTKMQKNGTTEWVPNPEGSASSPLTSD